jgi:ankyrin repeat protein
MSSIADIPTAPPDQAEEKVGFQQADFDALLLEAVIKGQHSVVRAVVAAGANVNHCGVAKKKTPLMIAVKKNDMQMVDLLLSLKAKPDVFVGVNHKVAAIHLAIGKNNFEMTKRLLDAGCDPNLTAPDQKGRWTPLHSAALHSSNEVIELLLSRGADIEAKTETEATPLALAARHYKVAATRYLISKGADVNTRDKAGSTPIIQACLVGATSVAKLLVEVGKADLSLKNRAGATALDEADRKDMWECALYIWSVGGESGAFKTTQGLGPVKWTRPRLVGAMPTPRYTCGSASIGSSMYLFGGVGYPEMGYKRHNPDHPFREDEDTRAASDSKVEQIEPFNHTAFYRLDLDKISHRSLIPSNAKKASTTIVMDREYIGKMVDISEDGLTVTCIDPDLEDANPSTARAAVPFTKEDGFAYFEVTVLHEGVRGIVAIGLIGENYPMDKAPGWQEESIGYHADDACAFHNTGWGRQWGKRYGSGDVVGCGIIFETGEVFYTLNGEFLGVAYRTNQELYYAAVGFRNALAKLRLNFGANPFWFDFRAPTLSWERLPSSATEFASHSPFQLFNVNDSLVLLGNGNYTMTQGYWVFNPQINKWLGCTATGEKPLIFDSYNYTQLGDSIYVIIHKDSKSLDRFYPMRPVIFRLQFSQDSLTNAKWTQLFPKPASFTVPQEAIDNWYQAGQIILREFPNATMVGVDGKLCFIGPTQLALLDPDTFEIEVKPYIGAIPPVDRFSTVVVGHEIETFGGWDHHSQRNEVNILDTRRAVWYQPHVLGISPRPRNHHSAAMVSVTNPKSIRSTHVEVLEVDPLRGSAGIGLGASANTISPATGAIGGTANQLTHSGAGVGLTSSMGTSSSASTKQGDFSSSLIVHAYGWNGCNYIDDIEVLSLQNKEPADPLISLLLPLQREEPGIVNFKFTDFDGSVKWLSSSAIVVSARASGFRKILTENPTQTVIEISKYPWHLFLAFITFLHDDLADFSVDRESSRMFCRIVDTFAPEHSKRIVEALVLTRLNIRSRMEEDLEWAFQNPMFSDITFQVGNQTLKAHKHILVARSAYFQSLLMGGLVESQSDLIVISDVAFEPFKVVIKYLYTLSLDLEDAGEYITDIFMVASKYSIVALRTQVEAIISYNLSIENAASLLLLAESHNAATLLKTCAKFIANNFDDVVQTHDYAEQSELIFTLVQPYLEKVQAKREAQNTQ